MVQLQFHMYIVSLFLMYTGTVSCGASEEILLDVPLTPGYLIYLAKGEIEISSMLGTYIKKNEKVPGKKLDKCRKYLIDYESTSVKVMNLSNKRMDNVWLKAMEVVKNPITVFKMTQRFTILHRLMEGELRRNGDYEIADKLKSLRGPAELPTLDDHDETIESILNLQQFYGLKPRDLVRGRIMTAQTGGWLSAQDALEIGQFALQRKMFSLSLPWLQEAGLLNAALNKDVANQIKELIHQHDSAHDNQLSGGLYMFEEKLSANFSPRTIREVKLGNYFAIKPSGHETYDSEIAYYNLINLCNGREFVTESTKRNLFCHLDTKRHPFFKIRPIKLEILSLDPYVILMHRAVPKSLFQSLWSDSLALSVDNATVTMASLEHNLTTIKRISKKGRDPRPGAKLRIVPASSNAKFTDEQSGLRLIKKLEMLSGLNIKDLASDDFVLNSYIHGNPIDVHCDHVNGVNDPHYITKGHRLSTIVLYMTNVEVGGGTAFPNLGFRVKPEVGSVLYWHTAVPNGMIDFRVSHEGCPAALGLRWIGAKFFRQFENFQKLKCDLKKNGWKMDHLEY